jgi:L-threonylcarbamoyladenylate synthase
MVQEEKDILRFVPQPGIKIFDYLAGADKPSHAIYEHVSGIAPLLLLENESMAILTPASSFCRHLVRRLHRPVITVAATFPGQAAPSYFSEVPSELVAAASYAVNYRRSLRLVSKPTSVVRWHGDGSISIFLS